MVFGSKSIFQPVGALAESSMFSAGAVPVLVTTIGTVLSLPAVARRAEHAFAAGERQLGLAGDVERDLGVGARVLGGDMRGHRIMPASTVSGGRHLELHVLGLAGIDRNRGELLAAVGLGERGVEILRRVGGETDQQFLTAVVLDGHRVFEARARGAAQLRQLRSERELGRQFLGERHRDRPRFVTKYLDPADRLEEVLCGLIMVLDFTLIAGLTAGSGKQGVRHLLIAALGCNVAWGIIDGALYVAGNVTARRQRFHLLSTIRDAPNLSAAFSAINAQLDSLLEPATSAEDRTRICQAFLPALSRIEMPEVGLIKDDVYGMAAIFLIDLAAVFPAVIPFLIFSSEPRFALRVSNALLIASLFVAGFLWGKHTGSNGYLTGCCAMLIGLALVGVAIALGG